MDDRELLSTPLDDLCAEARAVRDTRGRRLVTYSPKVFIPLTKLCRDVCHYCTFAAPPKRGERAYLTLDEVLDIARAGAAAGCREALFTLGDKPELRYRVAREELAELGCATTLEYLARAAAVVLEETGLLPHLNPGVLTREDLRALRPLSVSMGAMLETTSERLSQRGGPHFGSPDKLPAARLATLDAAGAERVPFTTGILIGIGETREERLDALRAIADAHARHGHIQEVIVQNFRAKPDTKMADAPEPTHGRPPLDARRRAADPPAGDPSPGSAEPDRGLRRPPRRRHRRLGRRLARDDRPRQPGGAVARDRAPPRGDAAAAASTSRRGSPSIPSGSTRPGSTRGCCRSPCARPTR